MDALTLAGLAVAGIGTGVVGYLTGMASLISFPAMIAAGLTPLAANVSQTLGLVGIGVGAAFKSTPALVAHGRRDLAIQLGLAAVGGGVGATLLLLGGEETFALVVPWLILLASATVLFSPQIKTMQGERQAPAWAYFAGLLAISTYGGYFGAGAGTIYLALSIIATSQPFVRSVLLKSVFLAASNLTASFLFIALGPVSWAAALALGAGCVLGGHLGPAIAHALPESAIRWMVAIGGVVLATWLVIL